MKTQPTYYGSQAYRGFASAIASQLGLRVKVEAGAKACIDKSGTIYIPEMNTFQTAHEFEATCGVIVHEMAHQYYKSHSFIDPNRARLEHDCLNAVLDVADETWVGEQFIRNGNGRPAELLTVSNRHAFAKGSRPLQDWNNPATHAWKVLCIGILSARLPKLARWRASTAQMARPHGVDADACFKLIRQARRTKAQNPHPTYKRFAKLIRLAKQLAAILAPFAPPAGADPMQFHPGLAEAAAGGVGTLPAGAQEATCADGLQLADGPVPQTATATGRGAGGRGGRGNRGGRVTTRPDPATFALVSPAIQTLADRLRGDADGVALDEGISNGAVLGQAHRLMTDGNCLARWNQNDHADGVAVSVILDCSGSMGRVLGECAGAARAFVQGMRSAGSVTAIMFGDHAEASDDFEWVRDMGGTQTDAAISMAIRQLETRSGKRWIVIVTDGSPNSRESTETQCARAAGMGIGILAIGLGRMIPVPHATCVVAPDVARLAIELQAAAGRIAA